MEDEQAAVSLPDEFKAFFWDYDPDTLSWDRSRYTIIYRLLERGGMRAVRWLRQHVSDEEIRDLIVRRRGRGLSLERLRFWGLILNIPRGDVDEWVDVALRNPWHTRTHR